MPAVKREMENLSSPPPGSVDTSLTREVVDIVRANYTKLLRKRNTYIRYFEKGLQSIHVNLEKINLNRACKLEYVPRVNTGTYGRDGWQDGNVLDAELKLDVPQVPGSLQGKEAEIAKKYLCKVVSSKKRVIDCFDKKQKQIRDREFEAALAAKRVYDGEMVRWNKEMNDRRFAADVARSSNISEAAGRHLGFNQIAPPRSLMGGVKVVSTTSPITVGKVTLAGPATRSDIRKVANMRFGNLTPRPTLDDNTSKTIQHGRPSRRKR